MSFEGKEGYPIYPIADGEIEAGHLVTNDPGYGNYIIVTHSDGTESLYGHMREGFNKDLLNKYNNNKEKDLPTPVTRTTILGYVGNTGKSLGAHLHLNVGSQVSGPGWSVKNPIKEGVPQKFRGEVKIGLLDTLERSSLLKIQPKSVQVGLWDEREAKAVHRLKKGQEVLIICTADIFDKLTDSSHRIATNPYRIIFKANKLGTEEEVFRQEIAFDALNQSTPYSAFYTFLGKEYKTDGDKRYYSKKWTPAEDGTYEIKIGVVPIPYGDQVTEELRQTVWASRTVSVGINGIDFFDTRLADFYDPNDPEPTEVVEQAPLYPRAGIPSGRTSPTSVSEGVGQRLPFHFIYADASKFIFSQRPDLPGKQNYTIFSARATYPANWTLRIKDGFNIVYEERKEGGETVEFKWNGRWTSGSQSAFESKSYSYQIVAEDIQTKERRYRDGWAQVIVDNEKPTLSMGPLPNQSFINAEGQSVEFTFDAPEDLYSISADILKGNDVVASDIWGYPGVQKGEKVTVPWEDAASYPDGDYSVRVTLTDLAGNQAASKSLPVTIQISNRSTPAKEISPIQQQEPQLNQPKLEKAPEVNIDDLPYTADIAFDNLGNMYAARPRENAIVKLDPQGKEVATITSFQGSPLGYPMGIAVKPDGSRIYVSDTYNNRLLVFDGNRQPIAKLEGSITYLRDQEREQQTSVFYFRTGNAQVVHQRSAYPRPGLQHPGSIAISNSVLFVVDQSDSRLFKFDVSEASDLGINVLGGPPHYFIDHIAVPKYIVPSTFERVVDSSGYSAEFLSGGAKNWEKVRENVIAFPNVKLDAIAIASDGTILLTNSMKDEIIKVSPDGNLLGLIPQGSGVGGISTLSSNRFAIVDTTHNQVDVLDEKGKRLFSRGNQNLIPNPVGVRTFDRNNRTYFYILTQESKVPIVYHTQSPPEIFGMTDSKEIITGTNWATVSWSTPESWNPVASYQILYRKEGANDWKSARQLAYDKNKDVIVFPSDGRYQVKVRALAEGGGWRDSDGSSSEGDPGDLTKLLAVVSDSTSPTITSEIQNIGNARQLNVTISDPLSAKAHNVRALLKRLPREEVVSTIYSTAEANMGQITFPLPDTDDGEYFVEVSASDDAGNVGLHRSGSLTVDKTPPEVQVTLSNPAGFSPNGDSRNDSMVFQVTSNERGSAKLWVKSLAGQAMLEKEIQLENGTPATVEWKGESAPEGRYRYVLRDIKDSSGNEAAPIEGYIALDITPPNGQATFLKNSFKDVTTLEAISNEDGKLIVKISEPNGETLLERSFALTPNSEFRVPLSTTSLGPAPLAKVLQDGSYSYQIVIEDLVGNRSETTSGVVKLDREPPKLLAKSVSNIKFSPNSDGRKDDTSLRFELDKPVHGLIEIVRWEGREPRLVRRIGSLADPAKSVFTTTWDGVNEQGETSPDGKYYTSIVAEDEAGNRTVPPGFWLEVDTTPPQGRVEASRPAFSPNDDGRYDQVEYRLDSSEPASLSFFIPGVAEVPTSSSLSRIRKVVWEKAGLKVYRKLSLSQGGGWEIETNASSQVLQIPDGTYRYSAYLEDEAGNRSPPLEGETLIDTTPPVISSLTANPSEFSPNDDGVADTTDISVTANEPFSGTLKIFREDGNIYKSKVFPLLSDPTRSFTWDGRGNFGELRGGNYTFRMEAEDSVGNRTVSEPQTLVVYREPSLIEYAYANPDPFAPAGNSAKKATEIVYQTTKDNLKVQVWVGGRENPVKLLWDGPVEKKGEYRLPWDGSFDPTWQGRRSPVDPSRVSVGEYPFFVKAESPDAAQPALVSGTVLVDNDPPQIIAQTPEVNFQTNEASLDYSLSEPSTVSIRVRDSRGNLIRQFIQGRESPGDHRLTWHFDDGKNESPIPRDALTFEIQAKDKADNISLISSNTFAILPQEELQLAGVSAIPQTFTPNGDGHTDDTRIRYTISGGIGQIRVTAQVLNSTGVVLATLLSNELEGLGTHTIPWDGKVSDQRNPGSRILLPDGAYRIELLARDATGTEISATQELLLVSTTPTLHVAASPTPFSPNGDGVKDQLTVTYTLNYPNQWIPGDAQVVVEVLPAAGEVARRYQVSQGVGTYTWVWDGLDQRGVAVPPGAYTVKVSAVDPLGTPATPVQQLVKVDYGAPQLASVEIENSHFSPNGDGVKDSTNIVIRSEPFSYLVVDIVHGEPRPAPVGREEVRSPGSIRSLSQGIMSVGFSPSSRRIIPNTASNLFSISLSWNGLNDTGDLVSDGSYSVAVTSFNDAGNVAFSSGGMEVDTTPPAVPILSPLPENTNLASLTISGTTEPNATVEVFRGGSPAQKIAEGRVDGAGRFSIPVTLSLGSQTVFAESIDPAGNRSEGSPRLAVRYETDAPVITQPTITPSIARVVGAQIRFSVDEPLTTSPVVTVNGNPATLGTQEALAYTYIYPVTSSDRQGEALVNISATDLAGNSSSRRAQFTIDTVTPSAPQLSSLPSFTNVARSIFLGSGEPFATIHITHRGPSASQSYHVTADSSGHFSKTLTLYSGENSFDVTQEDSAGNVSSTSSLGPVTYETTLPLVSHIAMTPNPAKAGPVTIEFDLSEPLQGIPQVQVGSRLATLEAQVNEHYRYSTIVNADDSQGTTPVTISVIDRAGNPNSATASFVIDTVTPTFSALSISPRIAKAGQITLTFSVSEELPENPVLLVNSERATFQTRDGNSHQYQYTVSESAPQGSPSIEVTGADLAGNQTSQVLPAEDAEGSFAFDTIPPVAPILSELPSHTNIRSQVLTGSAEANARVRVFRNGIQLREVSADASGAFNLPVQLLPGLNTITTSAEDAAGNVSSTSPGITSHFETDLPLVSNISISPNPAKAGPVMIEFDVSEPLQREPLVTLSLPPGRIATLEAQTDLHYRFSADVQPDDPQGGTLATIAVTDLAGNSSTANSSFVTDTVAPAFDQLSLNPAIARAGTMEVFFRSSEALFENPRVSFNGTSAEFVSRTGRQYRYQVEIPENAPQGAPSIVVAGIDLARNQVDQPMALGENAQFVIDTVLPEAPILGDMPLYTNQVIQSLLGTAEALSAVHIYRNGSFFQDVTADDSGHFSLQFSLLPGANSMSAEAEDAAGNVGPRSNLVISHLDTVLPVVSDVEITPDPAKAGLITISFGVSEVLQGLPQVVVGDRDAAFLSSEGRYIFQFNISEDQAQGDTPVRITIQDRARNTGNAEANFVVDTISPQFRSVTMTPPITSIGNIEISFQSSEELAQNPTVLFNENSAQFVSRVGQNYRYRYSVLANETQGTPQITITALDIAQNRVTLSPTLEGAPIFLVDTIPPVTPSLNPVPRYTNSSTLRISGSAEAGSTVRVFQNGNLLQSVLASPAGSFDVSGTLVNGLNQFAAESEDIAGNVSGRSPTLLSTLDTLPPTFSDITITPNPAKSGEVDIQFEVSEDLQSDPTVSIRGALASFVSRSSPYLYRYTVGGNDPQGETPVLLSVTDLAGNVGTAAPTFLVDTVAPRLSTFAFSANPVRAGPIVATFEVSEPLLHDPDVQLLGRSLRKVSQLGDQYTYQGEIFRSDPQGQTNLLVNLEDPARNVLQEERPIEIDTIPPTFSNFSVSQNPARAGTLTITFQSSEDLGGDPTVTVGGSQATRTSYDPSTRRYTFQKEIRSSDQNGQTAIVIMGSDRAGNSGRLDDSSLVVDTVPPTLANLSVSPQFAKEGSIVSISFSGSESVREDPLVQIGERGATLKSKTGNNYTYEYTVSRSDPEGNATVSITLTDPASNITTDTGGSLTIDMTAPTLTVTPSPSLANARDVVITVTSSELLRDTPSLSITPPSEGASSLQLTEVSENRYLATYTVRAGQNGTASLSVSGEDRARNPGTQPGSFAIDTTAPTFTSLSNDAPLRDPNGIPLTSSGNVDITFVASETLARDPDVYINGNPASRVNFNASSRMYTYRYSVTGSDTQGVATIRIVGTDPAGNGTDVTVTDPTQSFKIDTVAPVTSITDPIAVPEMFSPNLDGFADNTSFSYSIADVDPGSTLSLKVYRYRSDNDYRYEPVVKTLVQNQNLSTSGTYTGQTIWNGSVDQTGGIGDSTYTNGYADKGRYAFVVEVRDRAGNVSAKKGGTVWVQDVPLYVETPEQFAAQNPTPSVISANGPSSIRQTTFYYRLRTDADPVSAPNVPERFVAMSVESRTVGRVTVRVRDSSGNVVKTLVNNVDTLNAQNQSVIWDGTSSSGSPVSNGEYTIVAEAVDLAGLRARSGTLQKTVTVDNTQPTVDSLNNSSAYFNRSMQDTGGSITVSYRVQDNRTATLTERLEIVNSGGTVIYSSERTLSVSAGTWTPRSFTWLGRKNDGNWADQGTYHYRIYVRDDAGNQNTYGTDSNNLVFDTVAPGGSLVINSGATYTTGTGVTLSISASDATSGLSGIHFRNEGSGYPGGWEGVSSTKSWTLPGGDQAWTVYAEVRDNAGNVTQISDSIILDTQPPTASQPSTSTPTRSRTPTWSWAASTDSSGIERYFVQIGTSPGAGNVVGQTDVGGATSWTTNTSLGDGTYYLSVRAKDNAGNVGAWGASTIVQIDNQPPNPPGLSIANDTANAGAGAWTNKSAVSISWSATDNGPSGIREYRVTWAGEAPYTTTGNSFSHSGLGTGTYTLTVSAIDNVGLESSPTSATFYIDRTGPNAPSISVSNGSRSDGNWTNVRPQISWGRPVDPGSNTISRYEVSWNGGGWSPTQGSPWDLPIGEGITSVQIRAVDDLGNPGTPSNPLTFKLDQTPPRIENVSVSRTSFNPYVDGSTVISYSVSDTNGSVTVSGVSTRSARIFAGSTRVKDLGSGATVVWDGTNDSGDYVNEGTYRLEISASDVAGNPATAVSQNISLWDDQLIVTATYMNTSPLPDVPGRGGWILPSFTTTIAGTDPLFIGVGSRFVAWYFEGYTTVLKEVSNDLNVSQWIPFILDYGHYIAISFQGGKILQQYINGNWVTITDQVSWGNTDSQGYYHPYLGAGTYRAAGFVVYSIYNMYWGTVNVKYMDLKYRQGYLTTNSTSSSSWSTATVTGPQLVDSIGGPSTVSGPHEVAINSGQLLYRRNGGSWITISQSASSASITSDGSGNAYVIWRKGDDLYFQKIPSNFARVTGTISLASLPSAVRPSQSLTRPELITPKAGAKVTTLRPTFEWYGVQNRQEYMVEIAQTGTAGLTGSLTGAVRTLRKSITPTGAASVEADKGPRVSYTIHEFDEGLGRGNWFWRVTANPGLPTVSTSEVESFEIDPPLTISGVTNYPNPFNANAERTKIRYRLSRDADVAIRIYDITGALVREMTFPAGFTGGRGEGAAVFDKYDDVEWDGRNGVGDIVVNGIYPFEVAATASGTTVRGRGKIAVLK